MFKRFINLLKGFFHSLLSDAESSNPRALLELEKENLRKQIVRYNEALVNQAVTIEKRIKRLNEMDKSEREIAGKIKLLLNADERESAGKLALKLQTLQKSMEDARQELAELQHNYKSNIEMRNKSIQEAKEKIERLKAKISETEFAEIKADMQEMVSGLSTQPHGMTDNLSRIEEILYDRHQKAKGRIKVSQDVNESLDTEAEKKVETLAAEQALLAFEEQMKADELERKDETNDDQPERTRKELGPRE
ncbi:PspA/IM30 family protein [bacterium]|nr:PspA/IM30 family protein [candidate division CSSED10-310 bacterium]